MSDRKFREGEVLKGEVYREAVASVSVDAPPIFARRQPSVIASPEVGTVVTNGPVSSESAPDGYIPSRGVRVLRDARGRVYERPVATTREEAQKNGWDFYDPNLGWLIRGYKRAENYPENEGELYRPSFDPGTE